MVQRSETLSIFLSGEGCKSVHYKQTHDITNTGQIGNPIGPCSDPEYKNPKTINLSLPQPTPHLTTLTTRFLIMTIGTRLAPNWTTNSHVNPSPMRQWIDRMWNTWPHLMWPVTYMVRNPPIYLSFPVIWPSFPLLCNEGIFYFSFLFTCINYGSHFCAMKIPCSCLISSPLVLVA